MTTPIEDAVARHYTSGGLLHRIEDGLRALGVDPDAPAAADLKPADEFHTGGVQATDMLLAHLDAPPASARVLDIGSGLGGPARDIATRYGAFVDGVDLTPEFVETATALSTRTGLGERTRFRVGSALALPFEDASFDLALLMHVGMNVEDKPALFREARRVLRPGATFAVFDVMRGANGEPLAFPLPWAGEPGTSFVAAPDAYRNAAAAAGFALVSETDRSAFALDYFAKVRAAIEANGLPPLGIHLMMGPSAGDKIANYVQNVANGRAAPVEMIFRVH